MLHCYHSSIVVLNIFNEVNKVLLERIQLTLKYHLILQIVLVLWTFQYQP